MDGFAFRSSDAFERDSRRLEADQLKKATYWYPLIAVRSCWRHRERHFDLRSDFTDNEAHREVAILLASMGDIMYIWIKRYQPWQHRTDSLHEVGALNPKWYPEEESTLLPSSLCLTTGVDKLCILSILYISLIQGIHGTYARAARRTCPSNPTTLFYSLAFVRTPHISDFGYGNTAIWIKNRQDRRSSSKQSLSRLAHISVRLWGGRFEGLDMMLSSIVADSKNNKERMYR